MRRAASRMHHGSPVSCALSRVSNASTRSRPIKVQSEWVGTACNSLGVVWKCCGTANILLFTLWSQVSFLSCGRQIWLKSGCAPSRSRSSESTVSLTCLGEGPSSSPNGLNSTSEIANKQRQRWQRVATSCSHLCDSGGTERPETAWITDLAVARSSMRGLAIRLGLQSHQQQLRQGSPLDYPGRLQRRIEPATTSANPTAMSPERRTKKVDQDYEILGQRAALRATVALELEDAPPQGLRMLESGTHEDFHHKSIFSTPQNSGLRISGSPQLAPC